MSETYGAHRLGQSALDFKQNAACTTAIQRMKQDAITAWALTQPDEHAKREMYWQDFKATERFEANIDSMLADSKVLARQEKIDDT